MKETTADLHIHSYYSDGTMSPEEIYKTALENQVGVLAITDHDILEGSIQLKELCKDSDIRYISGVELDALDRGVNVHILGYGVDLNKKDFVSFVKQNRIYLDTVNSKLIERMEKDYNNISIADYNDYHYDRTKGGWKALHYLQEKGLTNSLREGFAFYPKYQCGYECVDFPSVETVCEYIHKAGGKAVLAHPGVTIRETDLDLFEKGLLRLILSGPDGIECYYPTHTPAITQLCLKICRERDLLITSGSDCHGSFGTADIGEMNIPVELLQLGSL